jgi:mannose-6-phosphate isomerase
LGLKEGITVEQLEKAIQQNSAEELLNWLDVYTGDMIYVSGGTVHTLGPGSVIVETQQQSDTTYRLYDYGRPRELHLKEGLAAVKTQVTSGKVIRAAPSQLRNNNRVALLVAAPYFSVDLFEMKNAQEFSTRDDSGKSSAQIMVALEGCGLVESGGAEPVAMAKGDAVVVPASLESFTVRPQWTLEFLRSRVPGGTVAEPETRLY